MVFPATRTLTLFRSAVPGRTAHRTDRESVHASARASEGARCIRVRPPDGGVAPRPGVDAKAPGGTMPLAEAAAGVDGPPSSLVMNENGAQEGPVLVHWRLGGAVKRLFASCPETSFPRVVTEKSLDEVRAGHGRKSLNADLPAVPRTGGLGHARVARPISSG